LDIVSFTSDFKSIVRESHESRNVSLRLSISTVKISLSEITRGLTFKLCGDMGVITKFPEPGKIIGPPQLSEYAVEHVGVANMIPSAQYALSNSPFKYTRTVIMADEPRLRIEISFKAKLLPLNNVDPSAFTDKRVLFSMLYSFFNNDTIAGSILS